MRRRWLYAVVVWWPWMASYAEDLIQATGADLVRGHCAACHSLSLVTAQRGDAAFWRDTIRRMQSSENLWPIPNLQQTAMVNYLATYYAPVAWGRRPNLRSDLLPEEN